MNVTTKNARPQRLGSMLVALALVPALAACGGEAESKPQATITDAEDLVKGLAVKYDAGPGYEVQRADAIQGQLVFISVLSDTNGRLLLEGDASIRQPVVSGELSTLVMDASEVGEFDVLLEHGREQTVLATVEVAR